MRGVNKKLLFSLFAAALVLCNNNAIAAEQQSDINSDVLGYAYVNNTVMSDTQSVYDFDNANKLTYSPASNNKDISAYTSMTKSERQAEKMQNKYAVLDNDLVFDPINSVEEDTNFWVRPYASIEDVKIDSTKFHTKTYGVYAGVNSGLKELGNGWDAVWGGYVGYTGAYIYKEIFKTYQNGGTVGFESMFLKDNFFTGLSVNTGAMSGEMNIFDITSTFVNAGISNKTGYNWELADGKFIIQPNMITSYVFTHTLGHSKHYGPDDYVSIDNDSLHSVLLEPGINFIGKFDNGWEPYAGVSVVWNIAHSNHIDMPYAAMPELSEKVFVKYGVGVRKKWNDRFAANLQTFVRNGGRSGIGFQGGFNVALGK